MVGLKMKFIYGDSQLHYEKLGEGHLIIMLHAMGTDHRSMKKWIEPIFRNINGIQRIYVDIPAHGLSKIGNTHKSTQDFLEIILSFIDTEFKNHSISLVGHSYGGYLAQGILSAKKEEVKGVCLLAPALHIKERNLPPKEVRSVEEEVLATLDADIRTAIETLLVYQTRDNIQTFLEEVQPGRLLADRVFLQSNWREQGYYYSNDPFNGIPILNHPTLLLVGRQDSICGYSDYIPFLDKFSNLSLSIINEAGHFMQIEKREVVQALFKDWVVSTLV